MESYDQLQTVALALAAVLACMFGLALVIKQLRQRVSFTQSGCEILSSTYLGPKERVVLLRVRDKEVLIGVGPTHMCALGEFPSSTTTASSPDSDLGAETAAKAADLV